MKLDDSHVESDEHVVKYIAFYFLDIILTVIFLHIPAHFENQSYILVNIGYTRNYVAHINELIISIITNIQKLRCDN